MTGVLAPGAVVDRYVVDALLGRGGMAEVYRVHHADLGSVHALKVLNRFGGATQDRLLLEGRTQAQLRHPNVVAVTDVVRVDGAPGLILEYVDGPNLGDLLDQHVLTVDQLDELAVGILRGVAAAHERGWIHRDLKPANVLCQPTDAGLVPKVADFGLVKAIAGDSEGSGTRSGTLMGTPAYMAPEQIRDSKAVDQRADVFALGAILYRMVTGAPTFQADDSIDVFMKVLAGDFVRPRERVPDLPERMERAILAALQVDRDARPPSCMALLDLWSDADRTADSTWGQGTLAAIRERESANRPSLSSGESAPSGGADGSQPTWSEPGTAAAGGMAIANEPTPTLPPERSTVPPTARSGTIPPAALPNSAQPPTLAPMAPPPQRTPWAAIAGAVLVGGAFIAVLLVGLGLLLQGSAPTPAPPAAEAPAAATPPAPVAAPVPEVAPEPAPAPEPVAAPEPAAVPDPAPAAVAPAPAAPAPAPAGLPAGMAEVRVEGVDRIWLVSAEGRFPAGRVPAGEYALHAFFSDEPMQMGRITLADGERRTITCREALRVCR